MKICAFLLLSVLFLNTLQAQETGNVGIGTTNPTQKLDVNGSVELPVTINSSTGILFKGGSPFLHDFKAPSSGSIGQNVFLGKNAGNFTMPGGEDYQSSDNTGIGTAALYKLETGYANTSVGSFSLYNVQSGSENSAIGLYGSFSNISGNRNSSLGAYAAQSNTSGFGNVSVGFEADKYNQAGSYNTMIGFRTGKGIVPHSKSYNVFIGYNAGYFETGSNKLYIENSNSSSPLIGGDFLNDKVFLNGYVGIMNSDPQAQLHVTGSIIMQDGNQANGKIMVSNAEGKAAWTTITTGDNDWTISGNNMYAAVSGNVGIGTPTPSSSAKLEISGTDKGFLPPRMTTAQVNAISIPEEGLMVYNTSIHSPVFYDGTGWKTTGGQFYIGSQYGGGIIFYIDGTGQHGLISATSDQSSGATWGCAFIEITGTATAIGTGQANTTIIVNSCGEAGIAARICNDLVLNGYSDWFLPSIDELSQMYLQKDAIGGFTANYYWSSSGDNSMFDALARGFLEDDYPNYWNRAQPLYVRAIRAF